MGDFGGIGLNPLSLLSNTFGGGGGGGGQGGPQGGPQTYNPVYAPGGGLMTPQGQISDPGASSFANQYSDDPSAIPSNQGPTTWPYTQLNTQPGGNMGDILNGGPDYGMPNAQLQPWPQGPIPQSDQPAQQVASRFPQPPPATTGATRDITPPAPQPQPPAPPPDTTPPPAPPPDTTPGANLRPWPTGPGGGAVPGFPAGGGGGGGTVPGGTPPGAQATPGASSSPFYGSGPGGAPASNLERTILRALRFALMSGLGPGMFFGGRGGHGHGGRGFPGGRGGRGGARGGYFHPRGRGDMREYAHRFRERHEGRPGYGGFLPMGPLADALEAGGNGVPGGPDEAQPDPTREGGPGPGPGPGPGAPEEAGRGVEEGIPVPGNRTGLGYGGTPGVINPPRPASGAPGEVTPAPGDPTGLGYGGTPGVPGSAAATPPAPATPGPRAPGREIGPPGYPQPRGPYPSPRAQMGGREGGRLPGYPYTANRPDQPPPWYHGTGSGQSRVGQPGPVPPQDLPKDQSGSIINPVVFARAEQLARTGNVQGVKRFMHSQGVHVDTNYCGEFVASVMRAQGGEPVRGYPVATNWASYGSPVGRGQERPGDIAIYMRNHRVGETGGHVGFVGSQGSLGNGRFQFFGANTTRESPAREADVIFRRPPTALSYIQRQRQQQPAQQQFAP